MDQPTIAQTCSSCEHCDTHESDGKETAGFCTRGETFFHGSPVPVWLAGCPHYSQRFDEEVSE